MVNNWHQEVVSLLINKIMMRWDHRVMNSSVLLISAFAFDRSPKSYVGVPHSQVTSPSVLINRVIFHTSY